MVAAAGIEQLEVPFEFNGVLRVVAPTLIWDENDLLLVDAGFPGQAATIRREIERVGLPFHRLNNILVTHLDWDHIGGLADVVAAVGSPVQVLAHELEKPYIQGDELFVKNPQRLAGAGAALPKFSRTKVTRCVRDGEELPFGGGCVAIHLPGHTLGHIALYHRPSRTLVSGDALNVMDGTLSGPNPIYTHDMALATESLKKLAQYDIRRVICYHGGLFSDDVNRRIAEIAATPVQK
jgi:glyoxylase-like metal-dependent hydrolase (beta-lactamase superfamily II)